MHRHRLLPCAVYFVAFSLLLSGLLAAESPDDASKMSVEEVESLSTLHSLALDAFRHDRTVNGKRAVEKIIKQVKNLDEDVRIYDVMEEDTDKPVKLAQLLVERKEQNDLARQYVRAFLQRENFYQYLRHRGFPKAVKKAYKNDREALYEMIRPLRNYFGIPFELLNENTILDIVEKRLRKKTSDLEDVRLLAWMTTRIDAWHGDEVSTDRLTRYRDLLKKGLKQYSDETVLRWRLGDLYYLMGEYDRASELYRKVMNSSFGKEKNKITDNSMFSLQLKEVKKRKDPLRYDSLPFLKLAASLHRAGRKEEAKQVLMRQLDDPNPKYKTQTRLAVIIGLWWSGLQKDAVSMLRERFITFMNSSKEELKQSWLELRWVAFRLYKYLRIMGRPVEALFVGQKTLKMTKGFGTGRSMSNLPDQVKKQVESLETEFPEKIRSEFLKTFQNRKPSEQDENIRKTVRKLVDQLSARSYRKRKKAGKKLKEIGPIAVTVLHKHTDHENPEVRSRINHLINVFARQYRMNQLRKKYKREEQ